MQRISREARQNTETQTTIKTVYHELVHTHKSKGASLHREKVTQTVHRMVRYFDSISKPAEKQAYRRRIERLAVDVEKAGRKDKAEMEEGGEWLTGRGGTPWTMQERL